MKAAERILVQTGGVNMNTWVVGNAPVGHHQLLYSQPISDDSTPAPNITSSKVDTNPSISDITTDSSSKSSKASKPRVTLIGEKTFLMKARIMAGQADIKANKLDLDDHKWLSKEEVQKLVDPQYWKAVRHALIER